MHNQFIIRNLFRVLLATTVSFFICGCSGNNNDTTPVTDDVYDNPVYVTVGTHIEYGLIFNKTGCAGYLEFRSKLLTAANLFNAYGVKWNLQVSGPFAEKVSVCDNSEVVETTGGENLLMYLYNTKNTMIDPHAHEDTENYTDLRMAIHGLGIPLNDLTVVGGFESGNHNQFTSFLSGKQGEEYPDSFWHPEVLSFSANLGHELMDEDYSAGMWQPLDFDFWPSQGQDGENYYSTVYDNTRGMAIAGMGFLHSCELGHTDSLFWRASDYVKVLTEYIADGTAPSGEIYTATIATTQGQVNDNDQYLELWRNQLEDLKPLVNSGKVVYVHFQELPQIWMDNYQNRANIF